MLYFLTYFLKFYYDIIFMQHPYYRKNGENVMNAYDLYLLSCDNIDCSNLSPFIQYLSPERQVKARNFRQEKDTVRTVLGEMLLRYALSQKAPEYMPEIPLQFTYNPYGKPLLPDQPDISFNISHSGNWIACAVSDSEVGIDIEEINLDIDLNIASHYFHKKEIELINTASASESYQYFFRFWTAKESYLKCIGKGLGEPLNNFYVSDNTLILEDKITSYHINFYRILNNYALSVCSNSSYMTPALPAYVSIKDLL